MNQTPLNPDALEAAKNAFDHAMGLDTNDWNQPWEEVAPVKYRDVGVEPAVSAYLAHAQPVVSNGESFPAKISLISWQGQHELDADLAPGETLVVLTVKTDRSWSLGDKAELTIHRPEGGTE